MNKETYAALLVASDLVESRPPRARIVPQEYYDKELHKETVALLENKKDMESIQETIGDAIGSMIWLIVNVMSEIPGVQAAIVASLPEDYVLNESYQESLHDNLQKWGPSAKEIIETVFFGRMWDLVQDARQDESERIANAYALDWRNRMVSSDTIMDVFEGSEIKEYVDESEDVEGLDYWLDFKSAEELLYDMRLYFNCTLSKEP